MTSPREIYSALRYQLAPVGVTTMGPCADGCGNDARGSGVCAWCLTKRLVGAGYADAVVLHDALARSRAEILDAEEWLEQQEARRDER